MLNKMIPSIKIEISSNYTLLDMILNETVINDACSYIKKYHDETCAIVFSKGLKSVRDLITEFVEEAGNLTADEYEYNLGLIKDTIERIGLTVKTCFNGKKLPSLSPQDEAIVEKIQELWLNFYGSSCQDSLEYVAPLLLQANNTPE